MTPSSVHSPAFHRLRRRWAGLLGIAAAQVAGGVWVLAAVRVPGGALQWGVQSALVLFWVLARLNTGLPLNHPPQGGALRPTLGLANGISLARAFLVAAAAGFIAAPPTAAGAAGWLAWVPGGLYLFASTLDYADGWLARTTATETRLGEFLDTEIDAIGLMVAFLYLVFAGRAPWVCLPAGAGYFVLKAAIRVRRRSGRPVHAVAARPTARLVAGLAMGVSGAAMLPVCPVAAAYLGAGIMGVALLESFARDWRVVCGRASADGTPYAPRIARLEGLVARALPPVLRAGILAGAAWILTPTAFEGSGPQTVGLAACTAGCVLGVAPRAAAMLLSGISVGFMRSAAAGAETAVLLACALSLTTDRRRDLVPVAAGGPLSASPARLPALSEAVTQRRTPGTQERGTALFRPGPREWCSELSPRRGQMGATAKHSVSVPRPIRGLEDLKKTLALSAGFRAAHDRPYVVLSYAQSVDGSIAGRNRERIRLSGAESMRLTYGIRALCDTILVGIGTVLADDPQLTVKEIEGPSPRPIVLDTHLRTPLGARLIARRGSPRLARPRPHGPRSEGPGAGGGRGRTHALRHRPRRAHRPGRTDEASGGAFGRQRHGGRRCPGDHQLRRTAPGRRADHHHQPQVDRGPAGGGPPRLPS